jgi:hypothetical protein
LGAILRLSQRQAIIVADNGGTPMQSTNYPAHQQRLVTVNQIANTPGYQCFTASSVRHLIFMAQKRINSCGDVIPGNGLAEAGAILRIGRRVLIDLDAFDAWLETCRCREDE